MKGEPGLRATFDRLIVSGVVRGRAYRFARPFPATGAPWTCLMSAEPGGRPVPVAAADLLACLDDAPEGSPGARAIRNLIGDEPALEALGGLAGWDHAQVAYLSGLDGPARIRLTREAPDLALLLPMLLGDRPAEGADPDELLALAIARRFVGIRAQASGIRAARRLGRTYRSLCEPAALMCVPRDWWPRDGDEHWAFLRIAMGCGGLASLSGDYGFLRSAKGRWVAYEALLRRTDPGGMPIDEGLRIDARGVDDCVRAFAAQALYPAIARGEPNLDEPLAGALRRRESCDPLPEAFSVLFGDKALPAILDLAADWHAHQRTVDARVGLGVPGRRWPVPFAPATAPNGATVRFLGDAEALREEGDVLDHCVGGYDGLLAGGSSCVASIGRGGEGGWTRLSTVEIRVEENRIEVLQHRGLANRNPPQEAVEALAWFVSRVRRGIVAPDAAFLEAGWRRRAESGGLSPLAGYGVGDPGGVERAVAAWAPFLRRPLRSAQALRDHPAARALALRAATGDPGPAPAFLRRRESGGRTDVGRFPGEPGALLLGLAYLALLPAWMGSTMADLLFALRPMRGWDDGPRAKADIRIAEWRAVLDILASFPDSGRAALALARAVTASSAGAAAQIAALDLAWFLLPRPVGIVALAWTGVALATLAVRCLRGLPRARSDLARVGAARARLAAARRAAGPGTPLSGSPLGG